MTEATQLSSKKIIGAPFKLYKLDEVSHTQTLTTSFENVKAAFISVIEATTPIYVSCTISGSTITFYNYELADYDVLVWGE